jgi:CubicO group peptidase (beta-lactamase class C family)
LVITDRDLDELAAEVSGRLGIPGVQISVLHRGQIAEGVAGVASIETGVPVTPDTLFSIGSTTKIYTAALVMQLVDQGSIQLDTPVAEQLPGFTLADAEARETVTPRHLMSMSSGIDNGPYADYGRGDDAVARYVTALAGVPHVFPPGRGYGYSNASTCVSGRLIEHVTGETWEKALETRLLNPAGLDHSAALPEDIIYRRFALGHEIDDNGKPKLIHQWAQRRSMGPAGSTFCSTATDLVRFSHLFTHRGMALDGPQVMPPESVAAMQAHEVQVPPTLLADWWGLGPYGKNWDGFEVLGHGGTTEIGSSYLAWCAALDLAVGTTVNAPGFGYPFAQSVHKTLFGELAGVTVPARPEPPDGVTVDFSRLVGRYAMSGTTLTVSQQDSTLMVSSDTDTDDEESAPASPLIPLTPTTFLPTHPAIDGRRGWALAFIGAEDAPATHLLNGFFALRRVAA